MFTKAAKDTSFNKVYEQKMTDESYMDMPSFDAVRAFLQLDKAAFWADKGHIPDDVICKVEFVYVYIYLCYMNFKLCHI